MELDFDKYCVLDGSPTTVLPVPRRVSNRKSKCGNDLLSLKEEFRDISFNRYRSASCKDVRSRRSDQESNEVLKRGSVYQSSKEVKLLKKTDNFVGRKKIELSRESASTFSFGIIDSLCTLEEDISEIEQNRSSVISLSEQSTSSIHEDLMKSQSHDKVGRSCPPIPRKNVPPSKNQSENVVSSINDGNFLRKKDPSLYLHKSLSAKLVLPNSPSQSESDSPKIRYDPVRKKYDPFVKSKSQRSPLGFSKETGMETLSELIGINKTTLNSRLGNLSKKSQCETTRQSSPAHLHAILKLENKRGLLFFEFSVKSTEEFYFAKTWKLENALTWIYTFHSLHQRRKSNASGWGYNRGDINREAPILGQMHVSSYPNMEMKSIGVLDESIITEFVLYDISHSKKSSTDSCESGNFGSLASKPLAIAELHPHLESVSIITQIPIEKRESLKLKSGDRKISNTLLEEPILKTSSCGKMHVVIPAGKHSLPSTDENCGPSSLLDRWRIGGGCDCGGWDMACCLNVFCNSDVRINEGHPLMDSQHPAQLYAQGKREILPAFTMRAIADGNYAIEFHAQLSSLQAFSICVAVLHAATGHERNKQMCPSDSMRVFPEEEIVRLIDTIVEEEKFINKKIEAALPSSFVVNPPFSPIARV